MKAKIWNFKQWNNDGHCEKKDFDSLLKVAGFEILNKKEHFFEPYGYTALWLLAESHFALHTFPEENKSFLELSSCVEKQFYRFVDMVKEENFQITIF